MIAKVKYPIDPKEHIAAMRRESGPDDFAEKVHREIIPFVNDGYKAGLDGAGGFPLDLEETRRAFAAAACLPLERVCGNFLITGMVLWVNRAYAQGRKAALEAARGGLTVSFSNTNT